jgi:hypothetical protein
MGVQKMEHLETEHAKSGPHRRHAFSFGQMGSRRATVQRASIELVEDLEGNERAGFVKDLKSRTRGTIPPPAPGRVLPTHNRRRSSGGPPLQSAGRGATAGCRRGLVGFIRRWVGC